MGSIHAPTLKLDSQSVFNAFSVFKPDIILYEADTALDIRNNISKIDGSETNEFKAIHNYLKEKPKTIIFPFD